MDKHVYDEFDYYSYLTFKVTYEETLRITIVA
jgi:hypothetical protein